ncbi:hypothetical protein [Mucilaginibacter terrae]|uniref:Gas vesicle protein n=1 Tax=Mucilaginibacter terrae TaxID=1955052 RepID=A0ABU3GXI5_9SPHI|nr:hypothetical protein [Mucilaginibacter terrae]MDT3403385.1 gas vesicle protein [Mucilaginibacter terrae]
MKLYICLILTFLIFGSFTGGVPGKTQIMWLTDNKGKKIRKEQKTQLNMQGDMVKVVEYTAGEKPFERKYEYTYKQGRKIKQAELIPDGKTHEYKLREYTNYSYDKHGRLVKEVSYDSKNTQQDKKVYSYKGESKNKQQLESYTGKETEPFMKEVYTYYADGLLKNMVQYAAGSWNMTENFKYDANKNLIYKDAEVDGGVGVVKYYYIYKNNLLVKDVVKVPDTGTEYHIYEYLP